MIAMPNSHLVLIKETLKEQFEKKISTKHVLNPLVPSVQKLKSAI